MFRSSYRSALGYQVYGLVVIPKGYVLFLDGDWLWFSGMDREKERAVELYVVESRDVSLSKSTAVSGYNQSP